MAGRTRTTTNGENALYLATLVVTALVFAIDCSVELGVAVSLPYLATVWLASFSRQPRMIWQAAILCSILAVVAFFLSPPGNEPAKAAINRALTILALVITAAMGYRHRLAQSHVEESERRARAILESAIDAMVTIDDDGAIREWNPHAEVVFGWTAEEVIGRNVAELIVPPFQRAAHREGLRQFLATGQGPILNRRVELTAINRAGREFPVELSVWPMRDRGGRYRFGAFVRDLSDRKRLERRFQAALEASPIAIVIVDERGKIALVNRETERLFGYAREELLGQSVELLVPVRFHDEHPALREDFFRSPESRSMGSGPQIYAIRKDGSEFPVEIGLSPLEIDGVLFVQSAIVDVTERLQAARQIERHVAELQRSNEELEQFAYVASHDLQEPLRKVASCCQVLADDYGAKLDDQAREWITFAVDGAARMRQLIADLLAYSRVGTRGKAIVPTDAMSAYRAAVENLAEAIEEAGAKVECDALPWVMADEIQLVQLIQNLIGNAVKYRGAVAPIVNVGSQSRGGMIQFHVRDNGIGIDAQYRERVFEIFRRLHGKDEYAGTGIGLAICKKAVLRMGGSIWVESQLGVGSTFYFTLAVAATPGQEAKDEKTDALAGTRTKKAFHAAN